MSYHRTIFHVCRVAIDPRGLHGRRVCEHRVVTRIAKNGGTIPGDIIEFRERRLGGQLIQLLQAPAGSLQPQSSNASLGSIPYLVQNLLEVVGTGQSHFKEVRARAFERMAVRIEQAGQNRAAAGVDNFSVRTDSWPDLSVRSDRHKLSVCDSNRGRPGLSPVNS